MMISPTSLIRCIRETYISEIDDRKNARTESSVTGISLNDVQVYAQDSDPVENNGRVLPKLKIQIKALITTIYADDQRFIISWMLF